ncbi:MAG: hypothetical protein WAN65_15840, partial [Candidatus Sulfotelmatobacter sp.]
MERPFLDSVARVERTLPPASSWQALSAAFDFDFSYGSQRPFHSVRSPPGSNTSRLSCGLRVEPGHHFTSSPL